MSHEVQMTAEGEMTRAAQMSHEVQMTANGEYRPQGKGNQCTIKNTISILSESAASE
jgi:hypothetical protein